MFRRIILSGIIAIFCNAASAGTIISAVGAVVTSGGPGFGNIADTYNQNGLSTGYTSGVTDFDSYLAGSPVHTVAFSGYEWFSNQGTTSASVIYDLGSTRSISALALWNEEVSGIGLLNLFASSDGIIFTSLASGLLPTDNPSDVSYGADVFSFAAVTTRYIRFDMSGCPQTNSTTTFNSCAIGEVAFNTASVDVPEPASIALFGLGLFGIARARRILGDNTAQRD